MSRDINIFENEPLLIDANSGFVFYNSNLNDIDEETPYIKIDGAYLVPYIGKRQWDGHIFVSGATGAGKSYLIRKIVDKDAKKRQAILFTNNPHKDPAYEGMKYVKYGDLDPIYNKQWLDKNNYNKILIFDDILNHTDYAFYRDKMLEEGRKLGNCVICVNHKLQDYGKTKVALNDCRFIISFPNANSGSIINYLKREMGLNNNKINEILNIIKNEGRQIIIHRFSPNMIAGAKSIFKI